MNRLSHEYEIHFRPEGDTGNMFFRGGHYCGKQKEPSVSIQPHQRGGSVFTHAQVDRLTAFLLACIDKYEIACPQTLRAIRQFRGLKP